MFGPSDHIGGAFTVRLRRLFLNLRKKPDLSFINPDLAVGGFCSVEGLWKYGINAILDLREEARDDDQILKKHSINYLRIGLPDRGIPSNGDVQHALEWIKSNLENNKRVFIHCNLGRGRAPLIACAYLISQGMSVDTAISEVKRKRSFMYLNSKQIKWIREFQNNQSR